MRKVIAIASALILILGLPALAAAQATQAKPDAAKAPAGVAGKWTMAIDAGSGPMSLPIEFKVEGKKVTGTVVGPQGEPANLEGEFAEGKLSFTVVVPDGSMTIPFKGLLKDDGSLAGTFDMQGNEVAWTATRVKS